MSMSKLFSKASASGSTGDPVTTSNWEKSFFDYINSGIVSSTSREDKTIGFFEPFNDLNNTVNTNVTLNDKNIQNTVDTFLTTGFSTNVADWIECGTFPSTSLYATSIICIDEYAYLIGGIGQSDFTPNGAIYENVYRKLKIDLVNETGNWEICGDYKTSSTSTSFLYGTQAAVIGDFVYLFGGGTNKLSNNTSYYFSYVMKKSVVDFKAGTGYWTNHISLPYGASCGYGLLIFDDYIYLLGGYRYTTTYSTSTYIYRKTLSDFKSATGTWTALAANTYLPTSSAYGICSVRLFGYVYLFGANYSNGSYLSIVRKSESDFMNGTGTWVSAGTLIKSPALVRLIYYQSATIIDNNFYIAGGNVILSSGTWEKVTTLKKQHIDITENIYTMSLTTNNYSFSNKEACKAIIKLYNQKQPTEKLGLANGDNNIIMSYSFDEGVNWTTINSFNYNITSDFVQIFDTEINLIGKTSIQFKIESLDVNGIPKFSIYDFSCICKDVV